MNSIRTRFILSYVALVVLVFGAFSIFMAQQISIMARHDFEARLRNYAVLIAEVVPEDVMEVETFQAIIGDYQIEQGVEISFIPFEAPKESPDVGDDDESPPGRGGGKGDRRESFFRWLPNMFHPYSDVLIVPEEPVVVSERDEFGQYYFYTGEVVGTGRVPQGFIQVGAPSDVLDNLIERRLATLWVAFGIASALAIGLGWVMARSIIDPIYQLRDSANQLSHGDFSHRVQVNTHDEIGELGQAFNHMAQQVEAMMEEQRSFVSNTSHELRTPLTSIRLRTESILLDETMDEATRTQYVQEIEDEAIRLTNMVQDLGYLSRLDAGRLELDSAEVNLNQIAQRLMRQFELLAREKNITLHFLSSEASVGVQASMDHLLIVFRNLLDNAIKYTPANGNVTWEMLVSEGRVINRIMDDGQGIEPDQLPHVFKRFYRGDKARSRHIVGYGLGLSLVKAIVEAYHAEITLASAGAGKGTTVTVTFPLAPSNQDDLSQS